MIMSPFLKPDLKEKQFRLHNTPPLKRYKGEFKVWMSKPATLLVSRINYCIVNYTSRLGEAAGGTCICRWERSRGRLRPHEDHRESHLCLAANFSRMEASWTFTWQKIGEEGLNYDHSRGTASRKKQLRANKHSGKERPGRKLFKVLYGLCRSERFSNLKMLVVVCNSVPCRLDVHLSAVICLHVTLSSFSP